MNINPELLQSAIVHQAVSQASVTILSQQLAEAQQMLAEKAKQAVELQGTVDALAADRKKVADEHAAEVAVLRGELDVANGKLLEIAAAMDFPNVDALLNSLPVTPTKPAPDAPTDSEGGETA